MDISTTKQSRTLFNTIRRLIFVAAVVGALVLVVLAVGYAWRDLGSSDPALVYYRVTSNDLPIVVTERGQLESQAQTAIRCKVESYDRNSGSSGSTILFIVPNGSVVDKGDLLVELDSAGIRDRLESESLEFESDKSSLLQAEAGEKNQISQNATREAEAKLSLELAKLDKEMYVDQHSGTYKLAKEEIERQIDDTRNTILEAQAALKLQETEKAGIEELFKLGYKGKSDLDQSRFAFMKAEAALAAAVNRLSNHVASRKQLEDYEYRKELLRLDGAVATAERNLDQVKVTNEAELKQVQAQLFEAKERVSRQQSRLRELEKQLEYCTIYAPHSGMVVYAKNERWGRYSTTPIALGATVRERQELLQLPDLSRMQIRTQIHEAVLDQVRPGLPVTVRVDAFPNRTYSGVVKEVAVVPSDNGNTSAKTYDCVVVIPESVDQLNPGMTAVSEIHIDRLRDVLSIPVQAVVQVEGDTWCYVETPSGVQRQDVELGRNNDKFVHVVSGIGADSRVVLNPMALYEHEIGTDAEIAPDVGIPQEPEVSEEVIASIEGPGTTERRRGQSDSQRRTSIDGERRVNFQTEASQTGGTDRRQRNGGERPGGRGGQRETGSRPASQAAETSANEMDAGDGPEAERARPDRPGRPNSSPSSFDGERDAQSD